MPLVSPYYSISSEGRDVYHDKSNCPDGERTKPENKRYGTDGRLAARKSSGERPG